jgi:hypothetical protein
MIGRALRRAVIRRAAERCEYCGLAQEGQEAAFHIDHIVPLNDNGETTLSNLALACVSCSLRKGAATHESDPLTGNATPLFHPRKDLWSDHFRWNDVEVVALTAKGRATIERLKLNRPLIIALRQEEKLRGRHPPLRIL